MKELKRIAKLTPTMLCSGGNIRRVSYEYNNATYTGYSICHPDDEDFNSPKVGTHIASSRAKQAILQQRIKELKQELKIQKQFYNAAVAGKSAEVDPTGRFKLTLKRTQAQLARFQTALRNERHNLSDYIKSQEEMIQRIRAMRANKDKND